MTPKRYKFQNLEIYELALEYLDMMYRIADLLPERERFNIRDQLTRAVSSIVLNIAEGSTGQSDAEQNRFLGLALRSFLETVACLDVIERRKYLRQDELEPSREFGHKLFAKIQAFRSRLKSSVGRPQSAVIPDNPPVTGQRFEVRHPKFLNGYRHSYLESNR